MVGSCPRLMVACPCIAAASHPPHPAAVKEFPCPSFISITETCLCWWHRYQSCIASSILSASQLT